MKMSILRTCAAAAALSAAATASAAMWRGFTDDKWYSGPKVSEESLAGKVVMVECWGVNCPPCRASLPRMENIWRSFKHKPFVLIGSHRQGHQPEKVAELVKKNKLTYPIYDGAGLAHDEPRSRGIPFIYVVNHRGKVVYSGHGDREATEAVVNALMEIGRPPALVPPDAIPSGSSPYKNIDKQLVFGKPAASVLRKLESDAKRGDSKMATPLQKQQAKDAATILRGVEDAKKEYAEDIERNMESNAAEALKMIDVFAKTFPGDPVAVQFGQRVPELRLKAREQAAAAKARAAEEAKAAAEAKRKAQHDARQLRRK